MRVFFAAALLAALSGCAEFRTISDTSGRATSPSIAPHPNDVETSIPEWGRIRATAAVLAHFPMPLWAAPDPNRTVEPCRQAVERASQSEGRAVVQAAGRGPERRNSRGLYEGAVEMRVLYDLAGVMVVRQATMRCVTRPDGTFVSAEVLSADPV